ncbi:MAG: hypothetical protein RLZZ210_989 [Pseudomonadota bacterium]|jgi:lipopolysaccharide export system permease protein
MNIFAKYLAKQLYASFLLMLLAFVALFIFFDFLTEIKSIGKASYSTWLAFAHVALQVPDRFYEFSPIAALIAGVFVLSRLSIKSEFVIMRTSGMKPLNLAVILLILGLPIVITIFLLGEFVSPFTEKISQSIRSTALGEDTNKLKSGIWLKNDNAQQKEFIRISSINKQNKNILEQVYIYKFSVDFKLQQILQAKQVEVSNNVWNLQDVRQINISEANNQNIAVSKQEKKVNINYYKNLVENININPQFFEINALEPHQLSIKGLYKYIQYLKQNKQKTFNYELALAKKMVYPFSALLMLFICIPFAYLHSRNGGIGIKMFAGIMLGLSFYLFYTLFSRLGNLGSLSVWSVQIIPFMLYSILGIIGYTVISKKG